MLGAISLSAVNFFYDIVSLEGWRKGILHVPWGVTANLLVRRDLNAPQPLYFDTCFPKTGKYFKISVLLLCSSAAHHDGTGSTPEHSCSLGLPMQLNACVYTAR